MANWWAITASQAWSHPNRAPKNRSCARPGAPSFFSRLVRKEGGDVDVPGRVPHLCHAFCGKVGFHKHSRTATRPGKGTTSSRAVKQRKQTRVSAPDRKSTRLNSSH